MSLRSNRWRSSSIIGIDHLSSDAKPNNFGISFEKSGCRREMMMGPLCSMNSGKMIWNCPVHLLRCEQSIANPFGKNHARVAEQFPLRLEHFAATGKGRKTRHTDHVDTMAIESGKI